MRIDDVSELGTILGVWAHPDDEAYLSAGTMAAATAAGQRVVCVHATRGDAGAGPDADRAEVGARREAELAASLAVVGVHEHHQLGYADGGCDAVPGEVAAAQLAAVVEAVRPDTILTFAADGLTGHPDHRAVHRWVMRAWLALGRPVRVLAATTPPDFAVRHAEANRLLDAFAPGLPVGTAREDLALARYLTGDLLDQKVAALRAHASQTAAAEALLGTRAYADWWAEECFVQPRPSLPEWVRILSDPAPARQPRRPVGVAASGRWTS